MKLVTLPAFADDHAWMLHDGREALVVDPCAAAPVRSALARDGLRLTGILVTHHPADHVGGLAGSRELLAGPVPGAKRVRCAQECTPASLRFSAAVEPGNANTVHHAVGCEAERAARRPTLPSRIERERHINPFLRCDEPAVIAAGRARGAADTSGPAVLAARREWKNTHR